jgi:hypothetical protein
LGSAPASNPGVTSDANINIVQKMAMMKTIVVNFILIEDPKSLATTRKGSQRPLQLFNMI